MEQQHLRRDRAQVLEVLRGGRLTDDRVKLTEDDVAAARHLVDLVRAGAPHEEVTAAAQRVHRIMNRPKDPVFLRPCEEYEHDLLKHAAHTRSRAHGRRPA